MNKEVQRYVDAVPEERKPLSDKLHALIMGLYPKCGSRDVVPNTDVQSEVRIGSPRLLEGRCFAIHQRFAPH